MAPGVPVAPMPMRVPTAEQLAAAGNRLLAAASACSDLPISLMPGLTGYALIEKLRLTLVQVDAREGRCHLQHEPGYRVAAAMRRVHACSR